MTVFIMGKVGGGHAMTLRSYLMKFPDANRERVRNRVLSLIDYMQLKGVSHGNLHFENILVTADSMGRLTGMWVIDFGRSRNIPLGMTEREFFGKLPLENKFWTQYMNNQNIGGKVEVRNGSRANVHMAALHYNKPYTKERANKIRKMRLNIDKIMKNYKSPKKVTSAPRAQSARRASPSKSPRRPRFSPSPVRKTKSLSPRRPSSKSAS
jgi:thiamine kinase-like enzyme